jgi:TrmH family RNA methyltransferase
MSLPDIAFVLVRPTRAANVAAACRALKNMGFTRLRIVGDWGRVGPEARALAYGAWDVLDAAAVTSSLAAAVADCRLVAGTSSRVADAVWTPRQLADEGVTRAAGGRLAVVFGPEASGLSNDELALCHVRVHIPTDAAQPSLNLAQAVLLLAYELRMAGVVAPPASAGERATAGELEQALAALRAGLLAIGYLNPDNPDAILAELRALLARAELNRREAALLLGLARQIGWAGTQLRGQRRGADNGPPSRGGGERP